MMYDKQGRPLETLEWGRLFEDMAYRRVLETTLPDGTWVSTVWLGLDHSFMRDGPPLIFETMVFRSQEDTSDALDQRRWATEAEAREGHAQVVAELLAKGVEHGRAD